MSRALGCLFDAVMYMPNRRMEAMANDPSGAQAERLKAILAANAKSRFGREHGFAALSSLSGGELRRRYREAVPVRSYEDFSRSIERMKSGEEDVLVSGGVEMFALTSGTSAEPKFCPVTRNFIREHHRQHLLWMHRLYRDHPGVNRGRYLTIVSPAESGRTAGGIPFGAMSGRQMMDQSIPVRRRQAVPYGAFLLKHPENRWHAILVFALARRDLSLAVSVNPSTLVLLADRLGERAEAVLDDLASGSLANAPVKFYDSDDVKLRNLARGMRPNPARAGELREILRTEKRLTPAQAWPGLAALVTWQGAGAGFYIPRLAETWGDRPRRCLGLRASEGTFSIPLRDRDPSGLLAAGGHVAEFFPADCGDPNRCVPIPPEELAKGGLYRLVVTTSGGLYRYDLRDVVEATGFLSRTPEIAFVRRVGAVISLTGEKVTEDQVQEAVRRTRFGEIRLNGFTVTMDLADPRPRYILAVEVRDGAALLARDGDAALARLEALAADFDRELRAVNPEYDGKRADGRLLSPRLVWLEDGFYAEYCSALSMRGRPDAQVKPPNLVPPRAAGNAGHFLAKARAMASAASGSR